MRPNAFYRVKTISAKVTTSDVTDEFFKSTSNCLAILLIMLRKKVNVGCVLLRRCSRVEINYPRSMIYKSREKNNDATEKICKYNDRSFIEKRVPPAESSVCCPSTHGCIPKERERELQPILRCRFWWSIFTARATQPVGKLVATTGRYYKAHPRVVISGYVSENNKTKKKPEEVNRNHKVRSFSVIRIAPIIM